MENKGDVKGGEEKEIGKRRKIGIRGREDGRLGGKGVDFTTTTQTNTHSGGLV